MGFLNDFWNKFYSNILSSGRPEMLFDGLLVTLKISFGAIILGIIIGFIIAFMRLSEFKLLKFISGMYISIIRGTPAVTQLLIINATIFATARNSGIWVGIVAMGVNSGAYVAEIIRAGILSVDKGQMEAGRSLGFTKWQTMFYIIIPQAIKNILPAFANEFIVLIKETAIVGYVAVADLTKVGQQIMSKTISTIPLFVTAFMYFIVISTLTVFLGKLEKRLRKSEVK